MSPPKAHDDRHPLSFRSWTPKLYFVFLFIEQQQPCSAKACRPHLRGGPAAAAPVLLFGPTEARGSFRNVCDPGWRLQDHRCR